MLPPHCDLAATSRWHIRCRGERHLLHHFSTEINAQPKGARPTFDTVLHGIKVRGSIVGSRLDLQEALNFAGEGKVEATVSSETPEHINGVFARMHWGDIQGRIVIDFTE